MKVCRILDVYNTQFFILLISDGCFEVNAAYPENDIGSDLMDLQECQDSCKKKPNCRSFTWTEGYVTQRERGVCIWKSSKRKTGQVSRDGDKLPSVLRQVQGSSAQRKVSGSVRNERDQHVWCRGKTFSLSILLSVNSSFSVLEPLVKENVIVRVGGSTKAVHLLAAFRNSAMSKEIRNFPALHIDPSSVQWSVPGHGYLPINETWNEFTHTASRLDDILTSKLKINNFNLKTDNSFTLRTNHTEIKYTIELAVENEESNDGKEPVEIISGPNTGNWPAETEADKIKAACRARNVDMVTEVKWTLDGESIPYNLVKTTFTSTASEVKKGTFTMDQEVLINPMIQFNNKELRCEVLEGEQQIRKSEPQLMKISLKMKGPHKHEAQVINVLQGQNKISWHISSFEDKEAKKRNIVCNFNGVDEVQESNGECSRNLNITGNEKVIEYGMTMQACSTKISATKNASINTSWRTPSISMRKNNSLVENGTTISHKEGTLLTMTCNAMNGEPSEVDSYTWKLGMEELDERGPHLNYTMAVEDDKKKISCIVNHQAFADAFYNNPFITPEKVGFNTEKLGQ